MIRKKMILSLMLAALFILQTFGNYTTTMADSSSQDVSTEILPKSPNSLPLLKVSSNGRFLVKEDGSPFVWLGDSSWAMPWNATREEVDQYLTDRVNKEFTVIMTAIVSGDFPGTNIYGEAPFATFDPNKPFNQVTNTYDTTKPNEAFFEHIDYIVNKAEELGLYVALAPTWGNNATRANPIFDETTAKIYGEFVGKRYRYKPVIWILGVDQNAIIGSQDWRPLWRAMADGLTEGDGEVQHLMSYIGMGGSRSAMWFQSDDWHSFSMNQSGHDKNRKDHSMVDMVLASYTAQPVKPVIDGEANFENIPDGLTAGGTRTNKDDVPQDEKLTAYDVRTKTYWALFSGAFGAQYGGNGVFQFTKAALPNSWNWDPDMEWYDALNLPGAFQMKYARRLLESRPFLTQVPDQTVVNGFTNPITYVGLGGYDIIRATRATDGSYAFVYTTSGKPITVNMDKISGAGVKAWWFNPRDGKAEKIGIFPNTGIAEFVPPTYGPDNDWILVLDDASKKYPVPGSKLNADTTVNASVYQETGKVTISGNISAGEGEQVTLKVLDPKGQISYIGQAVSGVDGIYLFSYTLDVNNMGVYKASVGGEFASSPKIAEFVYDTIPPAEPTKLKVDERTDTTVTLKWEAATDNVAIVDYGIFMDGTLIGSTTDTGYVVKDLTPHSKYTFTVRAKDIGGNRSGFSDEAKATTFR